MNINWIGYYTIVRREVWRLLDSPIQELGKFWVPGLCHIFVFGYVLARQVGQIGGHRYLEIMLPGVLGMQLIMVAYLQAAPKVYYWRFTKCVEEMLTAPLSYAEMIAGSLSAVALRTTINTVGILLLGALFGITRMDSWIMFLFWGASGSLVFGLFGIIVGLCAKSFEHLSMPVLFFLYPLCFLGGMFNTVQMFPPQLRWLHWVNPCFYFINGVRGSMIGFDEIPSGLGGGVALMLITVLGGLAWRLFAIGYGLRE